MVGEHLLDTLVGVGEDQLVDTVTLKTHGSRHIEVLVESKRAETCRIALRGIVLHDYLLGQRVLLLRLLQGEHRTRREILIESHTIVQIVPRRNACNHIIITLIHQS